MLINPNDSVYKNREYIKSAPVLSVLIATIPEREYLLHPLVSFLVKQLNDPINNSDKVEIIIDPETMYNIGTKRNRLLARASGEYIVFADDDDEVYHNYISLILEACKSDSDCIGINGIITTNGQDEKKWFISKEYQSWYSNAGIYYRTPNHISPVKRELALKAGFPEISYAEDAEYSRRLLPFLKTETIISEPIYHYKYVENK